MEIHVTGMLRAQVGMFLCSVVQEIEPSHAQRVFLVLPSVMQRKWLGLKGKKEKEKKRKNRNVRVVSNNHMQDRFNFPY